MGRDKTGPAEPSLTAEKRLGSKGAAARAEHRG